LKWEETSIKRELGGLQDLNDIYILFYIFS
jgi:hypothetical protein